MQYDAQEFWQAIGPNHAQALLWIGVGLVAVVIIVALLTFHVADELNGNKFGTLERSRGEKDTAAKVLTVVAILLLAIQLFSR